MVGVEASEQGHLHDGHCGLSITLEPGNFTAPVSLPPAYAPTCHVPTAIISRLTSAVASSWVFPSLLCAQKYTALTNRNMSLLCLTTFTKCLVSPFHFTFSDPSFHLIALNDSLSLASGPLHILFSQPGILASLSLP